MNSIAQSSTFDPVFRTQVRSFPSASRPLIVPMMTRSAALLTLLLQESAVDLDLASAVVSMDPGLAFDTLQLANLQPGAEGAPIWQFAAAVVAAGCDPLQDLVNCASKVESTLPCGSSAALRQRCARAVVRACVAERLAKRLGGSNPPRAYLAGLLMELPAILRLAGSLDSKPLQATLEAALWRCAPREVFSAVATPKRTAQQCLSSAVGAVVWIASELLEALCAGASQDRRLESLASAPPWKYWSETSLRERHLLIGDCCKLASWAATYAQRLAPWEFTARLQRRKSWECPIGTLRL
jgi:HDOD domain